MRTSITQTNESVPTVGQRRAAWRCILAGLAVFAMQPLLSAQTNLLENSGNVGIGTTSPETLLDVNGLLTDRQALVVTGSGPGGGYPSGNYWYMYQNGSGDFDLGENGWNPILLINRSYRRFQINMSSRMDDFVVASNGEVGIGTTSPDGTGLTVSGNTPNIFIHDTAASGQTYYLSSRWGGYFTLFNTNSATPDISITPGGNLGIGTTVAGDKLDVNGNAVIGSDYAGGGGYASANGLLVEGNVGIGTTTPTNKLEVNGTIRAKEVIVEANNWPDNVFASGYRLASLNEVEQEIKKEGHLPGIPSATTVAEKGITVGAMQAKLLAKIEELTLHMIRQQKQLSAQSDLLAKQSTQLAQQAQEIKDLKTVVRAPIN